jgi:purine/pyrimidine-nucleoside phosphorylase
MCYYYDSCLRLPDAGCGYYFLQFGGLSRSLRPFWPAPAQAPLKIRPMTTSTSTSVTAHFNNVTVATQASVYFDGKCISHGITLADGSKKSVGVILPSTLTFNTGAPEIMECVAGACEYKLAGSDVWVTSSPGEKFSIPGNSKFEIKVTESYHYICHFG